MRYLILFSFIFISGHAYSLCSKVSGSGANCNSADNATGCKIYPSTTCKVSNLNTPNCLEVTGSAATPAGGLFVPFKTDSEWDSFVANKPAYITTATAINGGLAASWSGWSGCSCPAGTRTRTKQCNNPTPNSCGSDCATACTAGGDSYNTIPNPDSCTETGACACCVPDGTACTSTPPDSTHFRVDCATCCNNPSGGVAYSCDGEMYQACGPSLMATCANQGAVCSGACSDL